MMVLEAMAAGSGLNRPCLLFVASKRLFFPLRSLTFRGKKEFVLRGL